MKTESEQFQDSESGLVCFPNVQDDRKLLLVDQSELEDEPYHLAQSRLFFSVEMVIQSCFPDCDNAGMLRQLLDEATLIPVQLHRHMGTVFPNCFVLVSAGWVYSHGGEQEIGVLFCKRKKSLIGLKLYAGVDAGTYS